MKRNRQEVRNMGLKLDKEGEPDTKNDRKYRLCDTGSKHSRWHVLPKPDIIKKKEEGMIKAILVKPPTRTDPLSAKANQ